VRLTRAFPGTATSPVGDPGAESDATVTAGEAIVSATAADGATRSGERTGMLTVAVVANSARRSRHSTPARVGPAAARRREERVAARHLARLRDPNAVPRDCRSERTRLNTEPKLRGDMRPVPELREGWARRGPRRLQGGPRAGRSVRYARGVASSGRGMRTGRAAAAKIEVGERAQQNAAAACPGRAKARTSATAEHHSRRVFARPCLSAEETASAAARPLPASGCPPREPAIELLGDALVERLREGLLWNDAP